jgi:hypothetical protein
MANKLRFDLTLKDHPYREESSSRFEAWGHLAVYVLIDGERVSLLDTEWDLYLLAKWYIGCHAPFRHKKLVLSINEQQFLPLPGESLAQALNRLQQHDFLDSEEDDEEYWCTTLFEFRERHSLRFALRGANIPEMVIGCNQGVGEISLSSDKSNWVYYFQMSDFDLDLRPKLVRFLNQWLATRSDPFVHSRLNNLLERLTMGDLKAYLSEPAVPVGS